MQKMASKGEMLPNNYVADDNNYTETYDVYRRGLMQQQSIWIRERVVPVLLEQYARPSLEMNLMSVGSGEGDIDIILLESVIEELGKIGRSDYSISYTVVERNPVFVERFRKTLEGKRDAFAKIKFTFIVGTLEEAALSEQKFDFIHIIHTLYYMNAEHVLRLCVGKHLNKGGILLAVVQSERNLYAKNWRMFSQRLKHCVGDFNLLCETEMKELAEKIGTKYSICTGKRVLDVTDIVGGTGPNPAGFKLLDFLFHSKNLKDLLKADELQEITDFIKANTSVVEGRHVGCGDETLLFMHN